MEVDFRKAARGNNNKNRLKVLLCGFNHLVLGRGGEADRGKGEHAARAGSDESTDN